MGILDRRKDRSRHVPAEDAPTVECPHTALIPRWDALDQIGRPELVSQYMCEACGGAFGREEGERLLAQQGRRLRVEEIERIKQAQDSGVSDER